MTSIFLAVVAIVLGMPTLCCLTAKAEDAIQCDSGGVETLYSVRDAIREVERPKDQAHSVKSYQREKARGNYQIRPCFVEECNRILGSDKYSHEQAMDDKIAGAMFMTYSVYWCRKTGDWSAEGIARRFNGGPIGHKKLSTILYWRKVRREMMKCH